MAAPDETDAAIIAVAAAIWDVWRKSSSTIPEVKGIDWNDLVRRAAQGDARAARMVDLGTQEARAALKALSRLPFVREGQFWSSFKS